MGSVFAIFSLLNESRAREIATALLGRVEIDEGGAFSWAKRADAGKDYERLCREVVEQLTSAERRRVAMSWRVELPQGASEEAVAARLLKLMVKNPPVLPR